MLQLVELVFVGLDLGGDLLSVSQQIAINTEPLQFYSTRGALFSTTCMLLPRYPGRFLQWWDHCTGRWSLKTDRAKRKINRNIYTLKNVSTL